MYKLVTKGVTIDMERKKRDAYLSFASCSDGTQMFKVEGQGRLVTLIDVKRPVAAKAPAVAAQAKAQAAAA